MLQALFLQHFNGFILHGTFVVCQEIYIIFSKIQFFPLEYCYCFVVTASALPEPPVYTAESCSNESVFWFFSTKSEQTAIQQSHIINPLLTSFARSVRESIAFRQYENLRQYSPPPPLATALIARAVWRRLYQFIVSNVY